MPEGAPTEAPPATLAAGAEFEGIVVLRGPARIDGTVRGQVVASDLLWVGETGCLEARVDAEEVVVAGEIRGDVAARRRLEIRPTGRIVGSVATPRLALAEGSVLEGQCVTEAPTPPAAADAPRPAAPRAPEDRQNLPPSPPSA